VEFDLGLAGSFLLSSDLGYSLYNRSPLHVCAVFSGEPKLTASAQSLLDGLLLKVGLRTHIQFWLA
jgi:hypothetical protein